MPFLAQIPCWKAWLPFGFYLICFNFGDVNEKVSQRVTFWFILASFGFILPPFGFISAHLRVLWNFLEHLFCLLDPFPTLASHHRAVTVLANPWTKYMRLILAWKSHELWQLYQLEGEFSPTRLWGWNVIGRYWTWLDVIGRYWILCSAVRQLKMGHKATRLKKYSFFKQAKGQVRPKITRESWKRTKNPVDSQWFHCRTSTFSISGPSREDPLQEGRFRQFIGIW